MRYRYTFLNILIYIFFINVKLFGQQYDFVKILSGIGIVYNNDSIILNKTSIRELHQILKIKEASSYTISTCTTMWDGYDPETGKAASGSGSVITREIEFKSIIFEFEDTTNKDNFRLRLIRMKEDKTLKIYTDNGFIIGMLNPKIREFCPLIDKRDYISDDGLTYNLYRYGISLQLEKLENNDLRIIEISTNLINE